MRDEGMMANSFPLDFSLGISACQIHKEFAAKTNEKKPKFANDFIFSFKKLGGIPGYLPKCSSTPLPFAMLT